MRFKRFKFRALRCAVSLGHTQSTVRKVRSLEATERRATRKTKVESMNTAHRKLSASGILKTFTELGAPDGFRHGLTANADRCGEAYERDTRCPFPELHSDTPSAGNFGFSWLVRFRCLSGCYFPPRITLLCRELENNWQACDAWASTSECSVPLDYLPEGSSEQ